MYTVHVGVLLLPLDGMLARAVADIQQKYFIASPIGH